MIKIFTDGASRGNPGPGGWGGIVVSGKKVKEIGGGDKSTTNNRMELTAVIKSLETIKKEKTKSVTIFTDSSYVLRGASLWIIGWQENNWKTKAKKPVENKDLWQKFLKASKNLDIKWQLLPGHSGIPANDRCDQIATAFADDKSPKLYYGVLQNYKIDINALSAKKSKPKKSRTSSQKAYSYVSQVGGVIKTHKTWTECERRVKGISKAKFKKAISLEDEQAIIRDWSK